MTGNIDDVEKAKILKALRFLQMLVSSLDRIGSYSPSDEVSGKLLLKFVQDYEVVKEAAEARTALCEFFDDEIPEGQDESPLEILMRDARRWSAPSST